MSKTPQTTLRLNALNLNANIDEKDIMTLYSPKKKNLNNNNITQNRPKTANSDINTMKRNENNLNIQLFESNEYKKPNSANGIRNVNVNENAINQNNYFYQISLPINPNKLNNSNELQSKNEIQIINEIKTPRRTYEQTDESIINYNINKPLIGTFQLKAIIHQTNQMKTQIKLEKSIKSNEINESNNFNETNETNETNEINELIFNINIFDISILYAINDTIVLNHLDSAGNCRNGLLLECYLNTNIENNIRIINNFMLNSMNNNNTKLHTNETHTQQLEMNKEIQFKEELNDYINNLISHLIIPIKQLKSLSKLFNQNDLFLNNNDLNEISTIYSMLPTSTSIATSMNDLIELFKLCIEIHYIPIITNNSKNEIKMKSILNFEIIHPLKIKMKSKQNKTKYREMN